MVSPGTGRKAVAERGHQTRTPFSDPSCEHPVSFCSLPFSVWRFAHDLPLPGIISCPTHLVNALCPFNSAGGVTFLGSLCQPRAPPAPQLLLQGSFPATGSSTEAVGHVLVDLESPPPPPQVVIFGSPLPRAFAQQIFPEYLLCA